MANVATIKLKAGELKIADLHSTNQTVQTLAATALAMAPDAARELGLTQDNVVHMILGRVNHWIEPAGVPTPIAAAPVAG
jgi:hypothetical protein